MKPETVTIELMPGFASAMVSALMVVDDVLANGRTQYRADVLETTAEGLSILRGAIERAVDAGVQR